MPVRFMLVTVMLVLERHLLAYRTFRISMDYIVSHGFIVKKDFQQIGLSKSGGDMSEVSPVSITVMFVLEHRMLACRTLSISVD